MPQGSHLTFLGTGAADWPLLAEGLAWPQPASYRRNAALLVDGRILIDGGPRLMESLAALGLDAGAIGDLLLTHSHDDHYNAAQITALALCMRLNPLRLWYPAGAQLGLAAGTSIELHPLRPGELATPAGYRVLALAANHSVEHSLETPLMYLFSGASSRWLYATDGAWLTVRTWKRLCTEAPLDALIIDATLGEVSGDERLFEHNSLPMVRQIGAAMRGKGVLKPNACVVLTHLARETHLPPAELSARDGDEGWLAALDGMQLTVSPV